ncbi:MAG: mannose-1-phosphate guanylyltransferase/mannose-6-phosphate isomerase [Lentilitoribacter sp.]
MTSTSIKITPIILCGGSGTRLWPLSRKAFPKQFLQLGEQESLFQKALKRLASNPIYDVPIILTNADYRFLIAEQARQSDVGLGGILLEPAARNTAPAIGAAAAFVLSTGGSKLVHVLPSDHLIDNDDTYKAAIDIAAKTAMDNRLVTFGITPNNPATGYGYIKSGGDLSSGAQVVESFVEKPDAEKAQKMLAEGGYSWNSGMFLFDAKLFLDELERFQPEIVACVKEAVAKSETDLDFVRLDESAFVQSPDISVDYAVFEHTDKAAVVPASISWSDIGSWHSLWQSQDKDADGNAINGPVTLVNATNNMVVSEHQHIALNGVSDLTIVATDDAVLVSSAEASEGVKDVVTLLKKASETQELANSHKTVYRPWGGYTSILNGDRFQVKRLFVTPGKKLSLQKHQHRSEHWVVVSGTAEVTVDDTIHTLAENQSVYIPLGAVHRLANKGRILLEVIEVQSGSYLGEDDIIRIEDDFGRGRAY